MAPEEFDDAMGTYARCLADWLTIEMTPPLVSPLRLCYEAEPILPERG